MYTYMYFLYILLGLKKRRAFLDLVLEIQEEKPDAISHKDMLDDVETFLLAVMYHYNVGKAEDEMKVVE